MRDSQKPIFCSGNMEVLPPLREGGKRRACNFPKKDVVIDVSPPGSATSTVTLEKVVHTMFPYSSENSLIVKNERLYLGSKRVGTISVAKETRPKMRIWMDDLVKSKLALEPHAVEELPKNYGRLASILPLSALLGMIFADARTLAIALNTTKYAVLVSEGFDEVRIEFHTSKRAKPDYSFLVKGTFIHSKPPQPTSPLKSSP